MRVAIVAPPWMPVPPPAYGGIEAVLDGLVRGVDRLGHDVLLYTTGDSTCPVEKAWRVPKAMGTGNLSPATELQHVLNAYDEIRRWGADIVHDHTLAGPLYGATLGLPIVTTNHGPFEGELSDLYRVVGERVPVVAISRHQAAAAAGPVAGVIHHGVDVATFPLGRGDGEYALFLGRMT